jgi:hypothetical protein
VRQGVNKRLVVGVLFSSKKPVYSTPALHGENMDQKKVFLEETSKRKDEWQSGSEVAGELTRLAAEIADGALIISGEKLPVGDSFSFVMKKS